MYLLMSREAGFSRDEFRVDFKSYNEDLVLATLNDYLKTDIEYNNPTREYIVVKVITRVDRSER